MRGALLFALIAIWPAVCAVVLIHKENTRRRKIEIAKEERDRKYIDDQLNP